MKIILTMASSLDGHITDKDGTTHWSKDGDSWKGLAQANGNTAIGRATYEEVKAKLFENVTYFVLTGEPLEPIEQVIFCTSPQELVEKAQEKGVETLVLSGGGETNYAFASAGLIDEIFIGIHPIFLREGKNLFGHNGFEMNLEKLAEKDLHDGVVQIHYKVLK